MAPGAGNSIHYNTFKNNSVAVSNGTSMPVDATLNWWGTTDKNAITKMFFNILEDAPVEFFPWLNAPYQEE